MKEGAVIYLVYIRNTKTDFMKLKMDIDIVLSICSQ